MRATLEDTDDYKIAGNGSIITFNRQPVKVKVENELHKDDALFITFRFIDRDEESEPSVKSNTEGNTVIIDLINYNNVLGTGTKDPIPMGRIGNESFYLHFRASALAKNSDKLLFYTVYSKSAVAKLPTSKAKIRVKKK